MTSIWKYLTTSANAAALAAGIALFGVIVSAFVSALVARRATYITTVTSERSKWIWSLRGNLSECIVLSALIYYKIITNRKYLLTQDHDDAVKRIEHLIVLIVIQLNPDGEVDKNIIYFLNNLIGSTTGPDYRRKEAMLLRHIQWLLKDEWEKVKFESAGPIQRYAFALPKRWARQASYKRFCSVEGRPLEVENRGEVSH
jgi:hypothetical protein